MSDREGNATAWNCRLVSESGVSTSKVNSSRFVSAARVASASCGSASTSTRTKDQTDSERRNSAGVWRRSTKMLTDTLRFGLVAPQYRAAAFAALDMCRQPGSRRQRGLSARIKTPILPEIKGFRRSLSSSRIAETDIIGGAAE